METGALYRIVDAQRLPGRHPYRMLALRYADNARRFVCFVLYRGMVSIRQSMTRTDPMNVQPCIRSGTGRGANGTSNGSVPGEDTE